MRLLLPNALTDDMVEKLLTEHNRDSNITNQWDSYPIKELVEMIQQYAPVKPESPSYYRIETRGKGHPPHYDGCRADKTPNHMAWCQWSAVALLTPGDTFSGGEFKFHDPEEVHREDLYKSLLVYSSGAANNPQKHEATPHSEGRRTMLLMFFQGKMSSEELARP